MPSECELPARCQDCAKSSGVIIHRECNICQEMEFNEGILCDLNRVVQDQSNFTCHAFRPILTLAGSSVSSVSNVSAAPKGRAHRQSDLQLFCSDKMKYRLALALQKLDRDPNGVFMEFKYHFVWNVIHRKPVFRGSSKYFTVKQLRPVRLRNYSKSITKTRRYESTKQDIKKDERPTSNVQRPTSNIE